MALIDDVRNRIPRQVLIEASNPREPQAEDVDNARLTQACASVLTRFAMYAQETYASSNAYHVELASDGVLGLLRIWGSGDWTSAKEFWEWFKGECAMYKAIGPRARITPTTNSPLTPSNEDWPTGETIRPWSDDPQFYDILPRRGSGIIDELRDPP